MTDHPLIFSPPMIRALRAGRKTQTRRLLSPETTLLDGYAWTKMQRAQTWDWAGTWVDPGPSPAGNPGPYLKLPWRAGPEEHGGAYAGTVHRAYPKIMVGDRVWVRERFMPAPDQPYSKRRRWTRWHIAYAAGGDRLCKAPSTYNPMLYNYERWSSAIHMPRWASRLTMPVTAIRIERLQAITEEDAIAEGVLDWVRESDEARGQPWGGFEVAAAGNLVLAAYGSLRAAYHHLWYSLHGLDSWEANPWVLVIEFPPVAPEASHG